MPTTGLTGAGAFRNAALEQLLSDLDKVAPGRALIHVGQSPFWDEPFKSIVASRTERKFIAAVHDLDYFSRLRAPRPGPLWQLIPRNDGSNREPWIATGEMSALFGAEYGPTRQALMKAGLRLPNSHHDRKDEASIDRCTESWGWRGIVMNTQNSPVVADVTASDAAPAFADLLHWGAHETAHLMTYSEDRHNLREWASQTHAAINDFVARNKKASLTDMMLFLLERAYTQLIGAVPPNVQFDAASRLLRFNTDTAALPRFRIVGHFLHERHSASALGAYAKAVERSGMLDIATVDSGALPFEVYIRGRGRGTLAVSRNELKIALPEPIRLPLKSPIQSVESLAETLESALGKEICLFGKALTFPAMLSGEFAMIFTEKASSYLVRTRLMLTEMQRSGIPVKVNPLIRIKLRTWSALSALRREFVLPAHMAQAFETDRITSGRIAREWKKAVSGQKEILRSLRYMTSPCEMVHYLSGAERETWFKRAQDCADAQKILLETQRKAEVYRRKLSEIRLKEDETAEEIKRIEQQRGALNRDLIRPLKRKVAESQLKTDLLRDSIAAEYDSAEKKGRTLLHTLEEQLKERRRLREHRERHARLLRRVERGTRPTAARKLLQDVERAAAKARLNLAVNALLFTKGIPYSNNRPSAWWMPAVDPSGAWFGKIARTAKFRIEPLLGEQS